MPSNCEFPSSNATPNEIADLLRSAKVIAVVGLSPSLDVTQRWLMIIFLATFPPLVLVLCAWLVSRHHSKLVSSAAPDAEVSIRTLSPDQQRRKLNLELSNLNGNAGQIPGIDVRSAYLVAEDLVLRQMEIEHGTPFMRHVAGQRSST